jgi:hypothetical protein
MVKPDMQYLNGRYFRDYNREQILTLKAVATLRKAKFTVDQIAVMQLFPEQINETVEIYFADLKKELESLNKLKALFENSDMGKSSSIFELASRLEGVTKNMQLPMIDLKFNFRRFDRVTSEIEKNHSKPLLDFHFGGSACTRGMISRDIRY